MPYIRCAPSIAIRFQVIDCISSLSFPYKTNCFLFSLSYSCGLVALRMVAEFLHPTWLTNPPLLPTPIPTLPPTFESPEVIVHITPLLLLAQELGFTNEGMRE